jgi:hypothetical protein
MTRRDFQFIANVINAMPSFNVSLRTQKQSCAAAFAEALYVTNVNFDREKFLAACNTNNEKAIQNERG